MIFDLVSHITVSAHTSVEADTLERAIEISRKREVVISSGHDGADFEETWVIEDADGDATDIHCA